MSHNSSLHCISVRVCLGAFTRVLPALLFKYAASLLNNFFFHFSFFFTFPKVKDFSRSQTIVVSTLFFLAADRNEWEKYICGRRAKLQHKTSPFINGVVMCLGWINEAYL